MAKTTRLGDPKERKNLPLNLVTAVLTESGYRCAVPTCRGILALDMHHVWEVSAGGGDELANLIALCPTCHALYHRGTIKRESIYAWKAMLVAIGRAFDASAIDTLMFLSGSPSVELAISGDGVLRFDRLIAAGLVSYYRIPHGSLRANFKGRARLIDDVQIGRQILYLVELTPNGRQLIEAWKTGDRTLLQTALAPYSP